MEGFLHDFPLVWSQLLYCRLKTHTYVFIFESSRALCCFQVDGVQSRMNGLL